MTAEPTVEVSLRSLDQIHSRNKALDAENNRKEREIEFLMDLVQKLTRRGLRTVKHPV